jgi:2-iminobutanoate/2-iminopropanoate deaminase
MRTVETLSAPTPAGHYSQAIINNGLVFVAGQLPIDPDKRETTIGTIEEQAERTLQNLAAILEAAGSDLQHVLQLTVYVSDLENWGVVNSVCARMFGAHRPARAVVPVKELHYGYGIEIQAIAALKLKP